MVDDDLHGWKTTISMIPLSFPVICLCFIAFILMSVLICFHIKLNGLNQTTFEQHKDTYKSYVVHPFSEQSIFKNFLIAICIKKPPLPVFRRLDYAFDSFGR